MWLIATKDKVLESLTNVKHYFQPKGLKYVIPQKKPHRNLPGGDSERGMPVFPGCHCCLGLGLQSRTLSNCPIQRCSIPECSAPIRKGIAAHQGITLPSYSRKPPRREASGESPMRQWMSAGDVHVERCSGGPCMEWGCLASTPHLHTTAFDAILQSFRQVYMQTFPTIRLKNSAYPCVWARLSTRATPIGRWTVQGQGTLPAAQTGNAGVIG